VIQRDNGVIPHLKNVHAPIDCSHNPDDRAAKLPLIDSGT
jgi:hypothetical protein